MRPITSNGPGRSQCLLAPPGKAHIIDTIILEAANLSLWVVRLLVIRAVPARSAWQAFIKGAQTCASQTCFLSGIGHALRDDGVTSSAENVENAGIALSCPCAAGLRVDA